MEKKVFNNIGNSKSNKPKTSNVGRKIIVKHIDKGVKVFFYKEDEEYLNNIKTFADVLKSNRPIVSIEPPLHKNFIKDGKINTYIRVGDKVSCTIDKSKGVVKELYMKNLSNMTVIIAKLEDGNIWLANQLKKI